MSNLSSEVVKPCCPTSVHAGSAGVAHEITHLFDTHDFPPRWNCGTWSEIHGWTHIASDLLIWSAYLAIPLALIYFIRRRRDVPFTPLFWLFGAFIIACGTTHLMEAIIFWWPAYRFAAIIKLITGIVSWTTVMCLLPTIPKALRLKTPDQLEREVNHRTQLLRQTTDQLERSNKELEQAKQAAEAATVAKSTFLANMSHEIRTPLTAILGFAEELKDSSLTKAEVEGAAQTIERNGKHLLSVINDILDLAKIEAGKLSTEQIPFDPRRLLEDTIELYQPLAREKQLKMTLVQAEELPTTVVTDPTRLRQIVANLLSNSLKFTSRGSIHVRAGVAHFESGVQLRIEVSDTGIGMSPDQLRRIFQPFMQGDTSTTRKFGGTGLGLTICKELAELLGGRIGVESREQQGTSINLEIPVTVVTGKSSSYVPSSARATANQRLDGVRILLAEDGMDNQKLISTILKRVGAELITVGDGRQAIEEVSKATKANTPFDVVLMDVQMPEMDGLTATTMLRESGFSRPIVALTAFAMSGDRDKCLKAGCTSFLAKPINRAQLIEAVHEAIHSDSFATADCVTSSTH